MLIVYGLADDCIPVLHTELLRTLLPVDLLSVVAEAELRSEGCEKATRQSRGSTRRSHEVHAIHRPRTTLGGEIALRANVIGVAPFRRHALRYLWQALARACSGAPRGSAARRPAGTQAQQLGL